MRYTSRISDGHIEKLHTEALKVLKEIGLSIENEAALKALREKGLKVDGTRVHFEPEFVDERLEHIIGTRTQDSQRIPEPGDNISLSPNAMPLHYLNPYTGRIEPMSAANLAQAAKFIETVKGDNVLNYVPGVPVDVPKQLSSLTECYIGAEFTSGATNVDTYYPEEALPYLFEMLEVQEHPNPYGWMYSVSPLRLVGIEFDILVKHIDSFDRFGVGSLPAMGVSSPIFPDLTWVVAIAEALGGALVLHTLSGGKPVVVSPGAYAFDLRTMNVTVSAPEETLMSYEGFLISRRYNSDAQYSSSIFTSAKYPGLQAGAEKYLNAGFALALGCRNFTGVGGLSEYDIFSPEQAIFDIEIKNMMERLVKKTADPPTGDWTDLVREGIDCGFAGTETTLANFRDVYYLPEIVDRSTLNMHMADGKLKKLEERIRDTAIEKLENYSYRPPKETIEEVRKIFNKAWQKLSGGAANPFAALIEGG